MKDSGCSKLSLDSVLFSGKPVLYFAHTRSLIRFCPSIGHKKGHTHGWHSASEGVLKHREKTHPQIPGKVKRFSKRRIVHFVGAVCGLS